MPVFLVRGKDEWGQSEREMHVTADTAKEAREKALNSRSMDGGIISVRQVKSRPRKSKDERGGPGDR